MKIHEDHNHVVYEKILKSIGLVVYVGEGDLTRANEQYRTSEEFNSLVDMGLIETVIVKSGLTKGEAETYESILIEKYGIENLYNKQKGRSSINNGDINRDSNTTDVIKKAINFAFDERKAEDTITPRIIVNEIIDNMLCTPNFNLSNLTWLNPISRLGEFFKYITDKIGIDIVKGNFTMINKSVEKTSMFFLSDNSNGIKMQNIKIINEDFEKFDTDKKYDIIVINPPFIKKGEKFVLKCISLLKKGGYLGCVMSPTWRSITTKVGKKAYYKKVDHFLPLHDISNNLGRLYMLLPDRRDEISKLGKELYEVVLEKIGLIPKEGENVQVTGLRDSLLWGAFTFGSEKITSYCSEKFQDILNGKSVNSDIISSVLKVGAVLNSEAETYFKEQLKDEKVSEGEKIRIISALACIKDKKKLEDLLEFNFKEIPKKNRFIIIGGITRNAEAQSWMWEWYMKNFQRIMKEFPLMHVARAIIMLVPTFGIGHEDEAKQFFEPLMKQIPMATDTIRMALEGLEIYSKFKKENS